MSKKVHNVEKWSVGDHQTTDQFTEEDRRVHESYVRSLGVSKTVDQEKKIDTNMSINEVKLKGLANNVQMEITTMLRNTIGNPYEEITSESSPRYPRSFSNSPSLPEIVVSSNSSMECDRSVEVSQSNSEAGFMGFAKYLRQDCPDQNLQVHSKPSVHKTEDMNFNNSEEFPSLAPPTPKGRGRGRVHDKCKPPPGFKKISVDYGKIDYSKNALITSLLNKQKAHENGLEGEETNIPTDDSVEVSYDTNDYVNDWLDNKLGTSTSLETHDTLCDPMSDMLSFLINEKAFDFVPCVDQS